MNHYTKRILFLLLSLLLLTSCYRWKKDESSAKPEESISSTVEESSENSRAEEEVSSEEEIPEEESSIEGSSEEETSEEEILPEESSEESGSGVETEVSEGSSEPAEEEESESEPDPEPEAEPAPDLTPVQTDSPVEAFFTEVPRPAVTLAEIPEYGGAPSILINGGIPFLEGDEMEDIQIWLTPLDELDRCGTVMILAGPESLPTAKRGSISSVHPTGWVQKQYPDLIKEAEGRLYRRCHMLMFALSGLNATPENLVTGTYYLNEVAMLRYEEKVLNYVRSTGHHVLYRCTPFFEGEELLMRGLLLEALSLEDDKISICVYCYNVQPGVELDYATGDNWAAADEDSEETTRTAEEEEASDSEAPEFDYIVNTNTRRFHLPGCRSVEDMKEENKWEVHCSRDELIRQGYTPCGNCNP